MTDKKKTDSNMNKNKKIQLIIASVLTVVLTISIPSYAWLQRQREIARLERIKSPDMLFITAADREDKININMNNIDVNAKWNTTPDMENANYKYFVFSVAGQYVTNYNLQLAHTKNNNYKYEIFEAVGSTTQPDDEEVIEKDYIEYDRKKNVPSELPNTLSSKYGSANVYPTIYYRIKKDTNETPISLNQGTYTITPAENGEPAVTKTYDGHYLNMDNASGTSDFYRTANSNGVYHNKTYNYDKVEIHSEPLYWQVTKIPVEMENNEKNPFYHEYILKVSWDPNANLTNLSQYKDTDIVYITVSVK